ncbi:MAG: ATP-binding protein [Nonomuraea sp.]|nr:ATP-binding protein [Nonomuraea sp.]NUP67379.1 ATP-binding protein [Nonomuraea sp.]NUP79374.1 ATP-binding protein [Nonomuraea sp.]
MHPPFHLRCSITGNLALTRDLIRVYARHAGLSGTRLDHLVLAVNEAAANVLEHGGAGGTVTAYTDAAVLTVEVCDNAGRLRAEHLADARLSSPSTSPRHLGLWLIQHLCDEVGLDHPEGVSRLRLRMRLPLVTRLRPWQGGDSSPAVS